MVNYNLNFGSGSTKKKRKNFPKSVIDIIRKYQGNKCAKCGKPFTINNKSQVDHKNGKDWDNAPKNCQLLHSGCHDRKTRAETTARAKKTKAKKTKAKKKKSKGFTIETLDPKGIF